MLKMVSDRWWILLIRGICAIVLGIMTFAMPGATLIALVWLFAVFMMADGIASVVLGFRGEADGTVWWTMVLVGALAILAGLVASGVALTNPGLVLLTLVLIIGVSAVVRGVFEIIAAIRLRKLIDDEWVLALSGLLSILFGVLIASRPGAGVVAIGILLGAFMLTMGILAVVLSLRLRKVSRTMSNQFT